MLRSIATLSVLGTLLLGSTAFADGRFGDHRRYDVQRFAQPVAPQYRGRGHHGMNRWGDYAVPYTRYYRAPQRPCW